MRGHEPRSIVLPYGDIVSRLLKSIFKALVDLCETPHQDGSWAPVLVNQHFIWLNELPRGRYPHLYLSRVPDGSLRTKLKKVPEIPTRISTLVVAAFIAAEKDSADKPGLSLPSPLKILLQYLTVPDEPASGAYAFATLRLLLFQELRLWPGRVPVGTAGRDANDVSTIPEGFKGIVPEEVKGALASINRYWAGRDNVPPEEPVKVLVCHLLAMEGVMNLRFGTRRDRSEKDPKQARLRYCREAKLIVEDGCEFRVDGAVQRLPRGAELINELWGLPLPIRGADTVFHGGLRFASGGGLIMAITGGPGTGKTSVALGLAAVTAPLGTRTFYVTAEESPEDLHVRLLALTPDFLRRVQGRKRANKNALRAVQVLPAVGDSPVSESLTTLIEEMKGALVASGSAVSTGLPLPCPLIVVIDGLHLYMTGAPDGSTGHLSVVQFILNCRSLGALVVLTWALEPAALGSLDYLVDVAMRLDYKHTERPDEKPLRVMQLVKTRHQMSRPGSHVFHISGSRGFRIAPQLPSRLDQKALFKLRLPDQSCRIDVLNRTVYREAVQGIEPNRVSQSNARFERNDFLKLWPGSHVLVHGRNSAGKSGFSLKLLTAPVVAGEMGIPVGGRARHRVLVVSFLYPESYYHDLLMRLEPLKAIEYPTTEIPKVLQRDIDVLHFFPGYLNAEDMATKILRRLDQADLEGEPFTGMLLDGVHNVFLQFPRLEQNEMIWPMLYGLFRRRDLTVVTTHTTITVRYTDDPTDEEDLRLRKAVPLLHAIVQGTDFFLNVNEVPQSEEDRTGKPREARYEVRVQVAIGQPRPTGVVYWHREKMVVYRDARQRELPFGHTMHAT